MKQNEWNPANTLNKVREKKDVIVGLDIGTSKVVAIVAEFSPGKGVEVIGMGSSPSRGLKKGVVVTYDTLPETSLVNMMWLTKHMPNKVNDLMSKNLVGELSNSRKLI